MRVIHWQNIATAAFVVGGITLISSGGKITGGTVAAPVESQAVVGLTAIAVSFLVGILVYKKKYF